MSLKFRIVIIFWFLLQSFAGNASSTLLTDKVDWFHLGNEYRFWCDSAGMSTVWDIVNKPVESFQIAKSSKEVLGKPNLWLRYDFENKANIDRNFIFKIGAVRKARVMIYAGRSQFIFANCGYDMPRSSIFQTDVSVPILVSKQWQQFSVYVFIPQSDNASYDELDCELIESNHANQHYLGFCLVSGMLLGFIIILLLYHAFTYFFLHDKTYLFFCAYLIVLLVLMSQSFYTISLYRYPKILTSLHIVFNIFAPVFYTRFSRYVTDVGFHFPRVELLMIWSNRILLALAVGLLMLLPFVDNIDLIMSVLYSFLVVSFLFTLVLHVFLFRLKNRVSSLFLAGTVLLLLSLIAGFIVLSIEGYMFVGVIIINQGVGLQLLLFSVSLSAKYRQTQIEKVEAQTELICQLEENQQLQLQLTSELEDKVRERTQQVVNQKLEIEEKNRQIMSSIDYAKLIQQAMLPDAEEMQTFLPQHFVLYKPRDVVSGDFYWAKKMELSSGETVLLVAAADCTGHGVPGGFISMLGMSLLNEIANRAQNHLGFSAADLLEQMRGQLKQMLKHSWQTASKDGMDLALCLIHCNDMRLQYAGANSPVFLIRNNGLTHLKPTRNPIGLHPNELPFQNHEIALHSGDSLYLFSDGFADQFGGDDNKRYSSARFKQLLLDIHHLSPIEQALQLERSLNAWKSTSEQIDDVMVMGIRI